MDPRRAGTVPYRDDVSYRTQYVLDLANPAAYRHVHDQMAALIGQLGIDYIKWDHNRDVTEPVHDGQYGLHEQTLACYRLFDDLKREFPGLEIESCSSGGARTDAGILQHTGRVQHADFIDPALRGRGVVSADGSHAVWVVAATTNLRDALAERLHVRGLDPSRTYRVRLRDEVGEPRWGWNTPQWIAAARNGGFEAPGSLLEQIGLQMPPLWPMQAVILEIKAM